WRDGRMVNGLVVVSYALGDVGPGDGGFAAVPGSHKSNLPIPQQFKYFEKSGSWLQQVPQKAGSAILFTEALTHGTWPWTAETERRSLLYKYTPGYMQWDHDPPITDVPDARWTAEQLRLLERPYIASRKNVV